MRRWCHRSFKLTLWPEDAGAPVNMEVLQLAHSNVQPAHTSPISPGLKGKPMGKLAALEGRCTLLAPFQPPNATSLHTAIWIHAHTTLAMHTVLGSQ